MLIKPHPFLSAVLQLFFLSACAPGTIVVPTTAPDPSVVTPDEFYLPPLTEQCEIWEETQQELHAEFLRLRDPDEQNGILEMQEEEALSAVTSSSDFVMLMDVRYWVVEGHSDFINDLIPFLTDQTVTGLTNSADVIIFERIGSGNLGFYGHGWVVQDDLFQVAGRASWILSETTGMWFGSVSMTSTPDDLLALQDRWAVWSSQFDCATAGE